MEKPVQLYGGLLAMASDGSTKKTENNSGKRKTKKTNKRKVSNVEEDGEHSTGNGKRGRPRVDRTDESAVEVCSKHRLSDT